MPFTLRDWFFLKDGRDSFRPRDPEDREFLFCHSQIIGDDILGSIQLKFATNEPIKMLILGDWGVGKTHLTHYMCWWLEKNSQDYPTTPVLIEIGDIAKNSRFDVLVRPFLDKLGLQRISELVHGYLAVKGNVAQSLQDSGVSAAISEAFGKFLLSPPGSAPAPAVVQAFEYLKGRKVSAAGASAGLGQSLQDSQEFVQVLTAVGEMHQVVEKRRLLFIADEAAKLEAVESDDASNAHWENANKLIFDDKNKSFGFVYTISGRRKTLPRPLFSPQLQNRLGDNVFELPTLDPQDVEIFLDDVRDNFVDRGLVEAAVQSGQILEKDFSWKAYPFTTPARAQFIDHFNRSQADAKPRDIAKKLDELGFVAGKSNMRLIDETCLKRKGL